MGKAKRAKKSRHRFDPLARKHAMDVDGAEEDEAAAKPLSAHQQRHRERKALQASKQALRSAARKVSKANPLEHKRQKKEIRREMRALKHKQAAAAAAVSDALAEQCQQGALRRHHKQLEAGCGAAADPLAGFLFSLPDPQKMRGAT